MKKYSLYILLLLSLFSCERESSLLEPGNARIYMPAAVKGIYNVPLVGTTLAAKNFSIDSVSRKVNIPLSVYISGRQQSSAFTVKTAINADTVLALSKVNMLQGAAVFPVAACTAPAQVTVAEGNQHADFQVAIDMDTLWKYEGGKIAFAVTISEPSAYELNDNITTAVIVMEVDPVLYGPLLTLTSNYIKNAGPIFNITQDSPPKGQCDELQQTPVDWKVNDAVKIFDYNGKLFGGVDARCFGNRDYLSCNNYAYYTTTAILNGKISQSFTLPKGKYLVQDDLADAIGGPGHAYMTIAKGDSLPDFADVPARSIGYTDMATGTGILFVLEEDTRVTFGFVYNFKAGEQCSYAIRSVNMIGRTGWE